MMAFPLFHRWASSADLKAMPATRSCQVTETGQHTRHAGSLACPPSIHNAQARQLFWPNIVEFGDRLAPASGVHSRGAALIDSRILGERDGRCQRCPSRIGIFYRDNAVTEHLYRLADTAHSGIRDQKIARYGAVYQDITPPPSGW